MTTIQGKETFLLVSVSGVYKYAGCMQNVTFKHNVDDIETTTIDSGTSREYIAGLDSADGSFNGVTSIDALSKYQYEDFVDDRRLVKDYRVYVTDSWGDILQYDFKAKTQSVELNSQAGGICKFSVAFLVSGAITKTKAYDHAEVGGDGSLILGGDGEIIRVP